MAFGLTNAPATFQLNGMLHGQAQYEGMSYFSRQYFNFLKNI